MYVELIEIKNKRLLTINLNPQSRPREVIGCVPKPCAKCCAENGCMHASPEVQKSCLKAECYDKLPKCPSCCTNPGKLLIKYKINS